MYYYCIHPFFIFEGPVLICVHNVLNASFSITTQVKCIYYFLLYMLHLFQLSGVTLKTLQNFAVR